MQIELVRKFEVSVADILKSPLLTDWMSRAGTNHKVTVTDVAYWDGEVQLLYLVVHKEPWPVRFILRAPTVDVLVVVSGGREKYIVFTEQYRDAIGATVVSNVAGGKNWSQTAEEAAAKEVREELGIDLQVKFSLKQLLPKPVLATPGTINEQVYFFQADIEVPPRRLKAFLDSLRNKHTGIAEEGESIILRLQPAAEARDFILAQKLPDAKTLLSLGYAGY